MQVADRVQQRKNLARPAADINVTPLVDVVLVLLIIFMVITPMLDEDIILPKAQNHQRQPKEDKQKMTLVIHRDKKLTIEKEPVERAAVPEIMRRHYASKPDKSIFLKADHRLPWSEVMKVMDLAREGSIEEISLVTDDYPKE